MNDEFSAVDVSKANETTSEPEAGLYSGMNLGDSRLLPRWCPAYRQHEPGPGSRLEHVKARPDTGVSVPKGNEWGGHARGSDETHLKCSRSGARASRENCSRNLGPASGAAVCLGDGSTVVDGDTS